MAQIAQEERRDEIIQEEGTLDGVLARRSHEFYGPIHMERAEVDNQGSYFYVDDPTKLPERAIAIRVPPNEPVLATMLSSAFYGGKSIRVAPANRWWLGEDKLAWTIHSAKIDY